jgi:hypothetical protein
MWAQDIDTTHVFPGESFHVYLLNQRSRGGLQLSGCSCPCIPFGKNKGRMRVRVLGERGGRPTSWPHRSSWGNKKGPLGVVDWMGRSRLCGRNGMSNVEPLIDPAATPPTCHLTKLESDIAVLNCDAFQNRRKPMSNVEPLIDPAAKGPSPSSPTTSSYPCFP